MDFKDKNFNKHFFAGVEKVAFVGLARKGIGAVGRAGEAAAGALHKGLYRPVRDQAGNLTGKRRLSGKRMLAAGAGTYLGAKGIGKMRGQQERAGQGYRNIYNQQRTPMM